MIPKTQWEPTDTAKAEKVARYYYAFYNFMGFRPTLQAIGIRFGHSSGWAGSYMRLARKLGLVKLEWDVRIPRASEVAC